MTIKDMVSNAAPVNVDEFLANLDIDFWDAAWTEYIFQFTTPPSDTVEHSFTVEFVYEDKVVSASTDNIMITP